MDKDSQTRKWQITINNPVEKGYTHEVIINKAKEFKSLIYMCMSDEVGEKGTFHTHIYMQFASAVRFSTLLNKYEGGHFEMCHGSARENRDYVFKEGKHIGTAKGESNIRDSHFEFGDLPVEREGRQNKYDDLFDMIAAGMSNYEIIRNDASYISDLSLFDKIRYEIYADKFSKTKRDIEVTYVSGPSSAYKTSYVFENFPGAYFVPGYGKYPFDGYNIQDTLVLDEYAEQFPLTYMNQLMHEFPFQLDARFSNRWACYTKLVIISNIDLRDIYKRMERINPRGYHGFLRRIHNVVVFTAPGEYKIYKRPDYIRCPVDDPKQLQLDFEPDIEKESPFR